VIAGAALLLLSTFSAGPLVVAPPDVAVSEEPWLAEAVANELPRALAELGVEALERYDLRRVQERLGLPAVRLSRATAIRVAEAVGAWRLVTCTVERSGSDVVVKVRLLDLPRAALAAPLVARGPVHSLPALLSSLAFDIALSGPTSPARSREVLAALRATVPFEARKAHAEALVAADPQGQARSLRRVLQLFPAYDEARLDLARLQAEQGEHGAALETLARGGQEGRASRAARFTEGIALLGLGRYTEAAALYAELQKAAPSPAALANEGAALLRLRARGRPATTALRQALEREPGSLDIPVSLGFALLHEGQDAAAAFFLRAAVRRDPRDAAARLLLSWALRGASQEAAAEDEWRDLLALTDAFAGLRQPELARRFERVLPSERAVVVEPEGRSDAELALSHLSRGEHLMSTGDVAGAATELLKAVALLPFDARAHLLLARALRGRGDVDRAEEELRASLYCREDAPVRLELAELLLARGRSAEARAEGARVLQADPGNAAARKLVEDRP
jgi:tetratricopeptide (TPR) repeat protein